MGKRWWSGWAANAHDARSPAGGIWQVTGCRPFWAPSRGASTPGMPQDGGRTGTQRAAEVATLLR